MFKSTIETISQYFKEYISYVLICAITYLFIDNSKLHTRIENIYEKIVVENNHIINTNSEILLQVKKKLDQQ